MRVLRDFPGGDPAAGDNSAWAQSRLSGLAAVPRRTSVRVRNVYKLACVCLCTGEIDIYGI